MKKLLASFLTFVLMLSLGACGCNKNDAKPQKEEETTLEAVDEVKAITIEETLVNYFTAYEAYDFEEAGKYLLDKSAIEDVSAELDVFIDELFTSYGIAEVMTENEYATMKKLVEDIYVRSLEYMSVDVSDVEETGDNALAMVSVKYIPVENVAQISTSLLVDIAMADYENPQALTAEDWAGVVEEVTDGMEDVVGDEDIMSLQKLEIELQKKDGIWYIDIE